MENTGYHVGIILDGNGRWATNQGKQRLQGHLAGFKNIEPIVEACEPNNISVLTLYAFAIANWKRDKDEVSGLWDIFRQFFAHEFKKLITKGAQLRVIGNRDGIPKDVLQLIEEAEEASKDNTAILLQAALNYDGVEEVARATQEIARKVTDGDLDVESITEETVLSHLDTADVQPPDVIIRTGMKTQSESGQFALWRSSSFLQLQSAQSVCVSTPILWPDFSPEHLREALRSADPHSRLFGAQRT